MPTYEYGCSSCGSEWEEIQRITEPPIEVCPKCSKPTAHRLISAGAGFILKGGGWYSDLYSSAKPSGNKEESKGTTPASTPSSESGSKSESGGKSEDSSPKKDTKSTAAAA
jgi:putative FmdB family regulatory protein